MQSCTQAQLASMCSHRHMLELQATIPLRSRERGKSSRDVTEFQSNMYKMEIGAFLLVSSKVYQVGDFSWLSGKLSLT